jgi:hypothetical protein
MKDKYIKLLLQLKIDLKNPNIIPIGNGNSHTIHQSTNVGNIKWRLVTYKYNDKLSYKYDYNVFQSIGEPVLNSPIFDNIDDLMLSLENDYDRLFNKDKIVIVTKSKNRIDKIIHETKPFI